MQGLEAGISLALGIEGGSVASVDIRSTRLVQASRMLAGRTPAQVIAILPTIFALCGTAQGLAAAAAVENALGQPAPPPQRMARRLLLLVETIAEHALGVLRDWPALTGTQPDLAAAKTLRPCLAATRRALYPDGDWARPGGGRLAVARPVLDEQISILSGIAERLFAAAPDECCESPDTFAAWVSRGEGPAAALLNHIHRDGLDGFGRSPVHPMAESGPADLDDRLRADHDGHYAARPDCAGQPQETNALTRRMRHPLIAGLLERHGGGLVSRFAARLVEITASLREAADLAQDLCDAPGTDADLAGSGRGLGRVEAARGLLVHGVELEEGVVRRYQILAPTEWNFHPRGPLRHGLLGAGAGPGLERRARLAVAALDPCVACTIEITRHA
ncbi:nickel-dependent hydrogenase large subunit [Magnetospirillum sp. SS-4]|uniref:nickel-dependent hydrogenase large subunit n=1 Tax=Magnetospirillum sp. SS-4 TaxID=2681465 RepID=UPI001385A3CE|nr:nickel-dependent hydrogenase large subunit [Magnetospirillum sp. SS-4]CAA7626843.1 Ni,Fe-hydrogenase I large subunit [Magnetospirillum sp. SS-4]